MAVTFNTLTLDQKRFSFYYIALCENGGELSDASWSADNYGVTGDPITIGILQWAGEFAGDYLQVMQSQYNDYFQTMPDRWKSMVGTGQDWWHTYITADEHETYQAAVQANKEAAKNSQTYCWYSPDFPEGLKQELDRIPYITEWCDDVKVVFYYMQLAHLSPKWAQNLFASIGQVTDLDTIANAAPGVGRSLFGGQWSSYGDGWTRRLTTYALDALKSWDGASAPPDDWGNFADWGGPSASGVTDTSGGVNGSANPAYRIQYVFNNYDDSVDVIMQDGTKIRCVKASGGQLYRPYTAGSVISRGQRPTGSGGDGGDGGIAAPPGSSLSTTGWAHAREAYDAIVAVQGSWSYSMDYHATDPWQTGKTDCSGFVDYVYRRFDPPTADNVWGGSYPPSTEGLYQTCHTVMEGSGNANWDASKVLSGDLFLTGQTSYFGSGGNSHVIMLFVMDSGIVTAEVAYSKASPYISDENRLAYFYNGHYPYWAVVRPVYA